jgi:hypothetical protein
MDRAARVGRVAKAVVYGIVGYYALRAALRRGGAFLDKEEVAQKVELQPQGEILLFALGAGLLCYAAWRFVQAIVDPRGDAGDGGRGLARRLGRAGSGVIHALFALTVFQTLTGADDDRKSWLATAIAQPGGKWLVIAGGLVAIGVGVFQLWQAYTASFARKLERGRMSAEEQRWAVPIGRLGLVARGVVLAIVGGFFVKAGLATDPSEAKGSGAALREIANAPLGTYLLPVIAIGLLGYAVLMLIEARYRTAFA